MLRARRLDARSPQDEGAVQQLLDSSPGYSIRVTGAAPTPRAAHEILTARPPGLEASRKVGIGLEDGADGTLVAVADVLHGWPRPDVAHIGLLIVRDEERGRGIGRRMHEEVLELARSWGDVRTLRIGIVAANAAAAGPFWERLGYAPTGEAVAYASGSVVSTTEIHQRPLAR